VCSASRQAVPSSPGKPPASVLQSPFTYRHALLQGNPSHCFPQCSFPNFAPRTDTLLVRQLIALLPLSLFPLTLASPISLLSRQDSCADTCGNTCYSSSDVSAALSARYNLYASGSTEGSGGYPHQ